MDNEYEREPVPDHARLGFSSFVGQYAGEHTAGTELMIGPLFVAAGVSAFDLIVGLLVGNVLAVLSWTFMTAPIATRMRLTLYYQLERICGRRLVILYNLANGLMFCVLAGSMITVSATALGVWFGFAMPGLTDLYPTGLGWILAVLAIGAAVTVVAAYGYAFVAHVANIAAPWMVLVFIAFGLVGLRQLGVDSLGEFWQKATDVIWVGGEPLPGQVKFTFWHTMFFAWFCNMAMHIGMADLTVFRFARRSWYGIASAAGMFLGHYLAWIAASILYVVQLRADPTNTAVLPGPLAYSACGIAGVICVIVAGWTTANPTIYRAGLAFQAIMPRCLAIPCHAGDRRPDDRRRTVPCCGDAAPRVRGALRDAADADGRRRVRRLLVRGTLRVPTEPRRARGHRFQLGCGGDMVRHNCGLHGTRSEGRDPVVLRQPARLVPGSRPLCRAESSLPPAGVLQPLSQPCEADHDQSCRILCLAACACRNDRATGPFFQVRTAAGSDEAVDARGDCRLVLRGAVVDGARALIRSVRL